jgi:DNA processing protein
VVVEANEKSGSLITARQAAEEGREVFAIPGPVDSAASAGTLSLLRNGAKLVRHARDLLDDLQTLSPLFAPTTDSAEVAPAAPAEAPPGLDDVQRKIWDFLSEPRNVDDVALHVETPAAALSGMLMTLELKKAIRRLPGNLYERF